MTVNLEQTRRSFRKKSQRLDESSRKFRVVRFFLLNLFRSLKYLTLDELREVFFF